MPGNGIMSVQSHSLRKKQLNGCLQRLPRNTSQYSRVSIMLRARPPSACHCEQPNW